MKRHLVAMGALAVVAGCSREPPSPGGPPGAPAISEAEVLLREYLERHHPAIRPGTPAYGVFIKDVLWGVYPELSEHRKADEIRRFATEYVNRPDAPAR
ncbi:hypothetical protein WME95_20955 [Sorangium sp. So ce327]|jgi:hypothetical protein|uniref:lipoprotein n=1 Tax=unclassified Sorangium TaxID=2621164 RepID=UPI003F618522